MADTKAKQSKRARIRARDGDRCHLCGVFVRRADASLDRVVPGRWGGTYHDDNVVLTHAACNSMRGDSMTVEEFRAMAFYELTVRYPIRGV